VGLTRARPGGTGHLLYNTTSTLTRNGGAVAASLAELYRARAIPPAYPWLDASPPAAPGVSVSDGLLAVTPGDDEPPRWWAVRARTSAGWTTRVVFGAERTVALGVGVTRVIVNAIDAAGNASVAVEWRK
jgi:hypothetical protein